MNENQKRILIALVAIILVIVAWKGIGKKVKTEVTADLFRPLKTQIDINMDAIDHNTRSVTSVNKKADQNTFLISTNILSWNV